MSCCVLGVDPSTRTGLAVVTTEGVVLYTAEVEFKKLTGFPRIHAIVGEVFSVIEKFDPVSIVIESMIVGQASSAVTVIQVASILRYFLWQEGILYTEVPPSTLKQFVAGKGNATKEQVMMHVLKQFGFESKTNNIADAVGLAFFGAAQAGMYVPDRARLVVESFEKKAALCN